MSIKPLNPSRGYIGGGVIAAVLGISPWHSPLDAYLQITNERPEVITPEKQAFFDSRKALEPWGIAKFYAKTGIPVTKANERYDDAVYPWMKAEIDFETEDGGNGETKTVRPDAYRHWGNPEEGDDAPAYVVAQVMHGMGVHPAEHAYVNALIGFDDHRVYSIARNEPLIQEIRDRAAHFWKHHIEPRRPPAPTTHADLKYLYGTGSSTKAVESSMTMAATVEQLKRVVNQIRFNENIRTGLELEIKSYMRDASTLTIRGLAVATWKASSAGIRTFRLK